MVAGKCAAVVFVVAAIADHGPFELGVDVVPPELRVAHASCQNDLLRKSPKARRFRQHPSSEPEWRFRVLPGRGIVESTHWHAAGVFAIHRLEADAAFYFVKINL